ncbi:hypothetical protein FHG64_06565 [Antarcticibacterium flavum]|uniref:MFS transporter n=2 Tax=Antarcticibacterium TaxID=2058174 RepID=A0A5B7X1X0_9FLAO|nr:hypothetical protein [Antarcticibacterium flavum]QCY69095.1 hypothetical protein FHG64_06565 [Antarcticibacterium flavum]
MAFISDFWQIKMIIFGFIMLYYLFYVFHTIGIFAASMKLCWPVIAATQFTLFMALSNMGRAVGSGLVGTLKETMTWEYVFICIALAPLISILFINLIDFKKQRIAIAEFTIKGG